MYDPNDPLGRGQPIGDPQPEDPENPSPWYGVDAEHKLAPKALDANDPRRGHIAGGRSDLQPAKPGPPIWLNPRFVVPALALIVAAIVVRSIITDDPAEDDQGQQGAPTTQAPATTTTLPSTTTAAATPVPGGLRDFGDTIGLGEDELDGIASALTPYDPNWWPTPANNPPEEHGPGLLSGAVAHITIPDLDEGPLAGVDPGEWTVVVVVYEGEPLFTGPPGAFTQLGIGVGCSDGAPEQAGPDGLGGDWDQRHFFSSSGYQGTGFGFASGDTVVIGLPDVDACPYIAVSNFFRDMQGDAPAASDPAEYQWGLPDY